MSIAQYELFDVVRCKCEDQVKINLLECPYKAAS